MGKWETCFWFSTFPRRSRRSCGNACFRRDFQGAVERGENLLLVFHAFHSPAISTALFRLSFFSVLAASLFAHRFSLQLDPVSRMH